MYSNELVKQQLENYPTGADSIKLDYEAGLNETLRELTEKLTAYENELKTVESALDKYIIKAPISGYVLITEAVCEGQNVLSNQQLMIITPSDSEYIFKGYLSDKDIADIELGANVELKLISYSYSDYGSVLGEIIYISPTIVEVNNNQVAYEIWVDIDESGCDNAIKLMAGMTGNVEVKVGTRTVMDYFLEPILGNLDKSLKEK